MSDADFLLENAAIARTLGEAEVRHLASRVAILDYVRIADEIAAQVRGRILDWGCGYGQMSVLLKSRGLEVVSYDVGKPAYADQLPLSSQVERIVGKDPITLPFPSGHFDAVLSCGVLEHVPDPGASLEEIHRILRLGGAFLIYNLPQFRSYKEFLIDRLGLGYSHENKYSEASINALLSVHDFQVRRLRRGGMLPHTLTGFPERIKSRYDRFGSSIYLTDRFLSKIPLLNRLAEALEVVAEAAGR